MDPAVLRVGREAQAPAPLVRPLLLIQPTHSSQDWFSFPEIIIECEDVGEISVISRYFLFDFVFVFLL
eukprot:COSAG05_NODE_14391_length_398_cov_0.692308_1_plen_67_part_10